MKSDTLGRFQLLHKLKLQHAATLQQIHCAPPFLEVIYGPQPPVEISLTKSGYLSKSLIQKWTLGRHWEKIWILPILFARITAGIPCLQRLHNWLSWGLPKFEMEFTPAGTGSLEIAASLDQAVENVFVLFLCRSRRAQLALVCHQF